MSRYDDINAKLETLTGVADPESVKEEMAEFDVRDIQAVWVAQGGVTSGNVHVRGNLAVAGQVGFFDKEPVDQPTLVAGKATVQDIINALVQLGLVRQVRG